jgi:hypothetical protein
VGLVATGLLEGDEQERLGSVEWDDLAEAAVQTERLGAIGQGQNDGELAAGMAGGVKRQVDEAGGAGAAQVPEAARDGARQVNLSVVEAQGGGTGVFEWE